MKWKKLKRLFVTEGQAEWMLSHASNPFVETLPDEKWLVYFSSRDSLNRSHIVAIIINPYKDYKIEALSPRPILSPGHIGLFDDSGASMGCLIHKEGKRYLYYLGWNLRVTVPWQNSIGLAISEVFDSQGFPIFEKYSPAPLLDRSKEDPYSLSYPIILRDAEMYKMWYGSNLNWGKRIEEMHHVIKYAESIDGVIWKREGKIAIETIYPSEYAISRPCVIKENNMYKMWYSYRGRGTIQTYRIGYAESLDGIHWVRKDDLVGIDVSETGWDSEMICYPYVFDWRGERYMLYNGNQYGKTGFGLAILEKTQRQ